MPNSRLYTKIGEYWEETDFTLTRVTGTTAPEFPDATNTGPTVAPAALRNIPGEVSSGTGWRLRTDVPKHFIEITANGTLFENYTTDLAIEVVANNVTIRNVVCKASGETWGIGMRSASGTLIENVEIGPAVGQMRLKTGVKDINGLSTGTTVRNSEIYRVSTGIQMGEGNLSGNYIHDIMVYGDDHCNGITSNVTSGALTITGNTVLVPLVQTDAIGLFQDFGIQKDVTIDGNLLAGGAYVIYGGNGSHGATSNIVIRNNVFSNRYFPKSGYWGILAAFTPTGPGNVWSNNVWEHDRSTQIPVSPA